MPPSAMPRSGSLSTPVMREDTDTWENEARRQEEIRMRDAIRSHCRDQLDACVADPHSVMTQRDMEGYLISMQEENLDDPQWQTEEEKTRAVQKMGGAWAQEFIHKAKDVGDRALHLIDEAEEKKWILKSTADAWRRKLKDQSSTGLQKTEFIENELPVWQKNWAQIAANYKDVLKQEKDLGITKEDIAQHSVLSTFHDPAMMSGKLKYPDRRWRTDKALAFLKTFKPGMKAKTKEGKKELAVRARNELQRAIDAKAVDEGKAMYWLETKVLCKPPKELEKYIDVDLKAYVRSCVETRVAFDHMDGQMQKHGVPQGFNQLSPTKFLALTLNQRKSYVRMAKERMEEKEANKDPEMGNLKLGVRNAMETKDWEEAEGFLKKAHTLLVRGKGSAADKSDLDSMERYLRDFRDKEKKNQPKEDARKTLQEMRAVFDQVPESLQELYLGAMNDSYECAATVFRMVYNLKWATDHGYCDANRMAILRESAKEETDRRAKGEHGKKGVENIDLAYVSDPGHAAAVRTYTAGEWAPTYIHKRRGEEGKVLSLARAHKDNNAFGYWVILDPVGVPQENIVSLVENVHWKLKSGMRKLKKAGLRFTRTGDPVSVN